VSISIHPYSAAHVEAVRQLNDRLRAGGETSQFPISPVPEWLPNVAGRKPFQEYYVADDDRGAVRGGYILKHEDFWIRDRVVPLADLQLPLSEGVVDKAYVPIGPLVLRHALQTQPLLFGLGMGGPRESLARLLQAAGWTMFAVPFFFRIVHPAAFLRNLAILRRRGPVARWTFDALAMSGVGWLGVRGVQAFYRRRVPADPDVAFEPQNEFSAWADLLWDECKTQYGMSAVRNAETLQVLYPQADPRFIRLLVTRRRRPIGWAVLLDTRVAGHKQFGDMRLGSIVNCLAATAETAHVAGAARTFLESQGVDLIISNQSHAAWCRGLRQAGFLQGPSNFLFAASRDLAKLLDRQGVRNEDLHVNRGDGDGPINL
jgi:hypothetical protein